MRIGIEEHLVGSRAVSFQRAAAASQTYLFVYPLALEQMLAGLLYFLVKAILTSRERVRLSRH